MLSTIYIRVADWNSKRYERQYNHEMSCHLFFEEYWEFFDAGGEQVEELDALCDMIYVGFGILWKLNLTNEQLDQAMADGREGMVRIMETNLFPPVIAMSSMFMSFQHDDDTALTSGIAACIWLALAQMLAMGLTQEQCEEALLIVCDSNDTKTVVKSKPNEDAKDGAKGALFVDPKPKLRKLLEKVNVHLH